MSRLNSILKAIDIANNKEEQEVIIKISDLIILKNEIECLREKIKIINELEKNQEMIINKLKKLEKAKYKKIDDFIVKED